METLLKKQAARKLREYTKMPARTICHRLKSIQIIEELLSHSIEIKIKGLKSK